MKNLDMLIAEKEKLQKQLDFAEQKIKDYKNKKTGIPSVGSNAYFLEGNGLVVTVAWGGQKWDWDNLNQGNVFLIFDEAIAESKRRTIHQEIKAYANECNGGTEVDWKDTGQVKFFISAYVIDKEIHIIRTYLLAYPNQIHFLNDEDAEKCIELIGKQRLLKDYFQVPT